MATTMELKMTEAGLKKSSVKKTKKPWRHAKTKRNTVMSWDHDYFGKLDVGIDNHTVLASMDMDGYSWAQVVIGDKTPNYLFVTFTANLADEVTCVLQARGNEVEQCFGNLPGMRVRVKWSDDGRPQTRKKDEDNLDHFLCTNEGVVMQLQTSFTTRGENFFIANQELWCLQIVETTEENPPYKTHEVNGKHYAAINLWDSNAYLGADWLFTNSQTGPKVIEAVLASGIVPAVVDILPTTEWDPPAFPKEEGFTGAIVMWFNPNVGAKVLCEDNEVRFVPLKGIRDIDGRNMMKRGEFVVVAPRQPVLLSLEMANTPGAFNAIRPIE